MGSSCRRQCSRTSLWSISWLILKLKLCVTELKLMTRSHFIRYLPNMCLMSVSGLLSIP